MINSEKVYNFLLERIIHGEYPPGKTLRLDLISNEIGVSRTPVRDALRQLEKLGLVSIIPYFGAKVKEMDAKEYRDTCGVRLALEVYAAGLAAENRSEDELHVMRQALDSMRSITMRSHKPTPQNRSASFENLVSEDVRFHVAIISASKNIVVKKEILRLHIIDRVISLTPRGLTPGHNLDSNGRTYNSNFDIAKEHEAIFRAIENRDTAAASLAMKLHIQVIIDSALLSFPISEKIKAPFVLTDEEQMYSGTH